MARFTMALNSMFVLLCLGVLNSTNAFPNSNIRTSPLDSLTGFSANTGTGDRTRRDLLFEAGGLALSSLVLGQALPAFAEGSDPQTIVVTGANSGIGFDACKRLAQQGHNLVLACRTMEKSVATADRLKDLGGNLIPAECDLANFASIQAFADKLPSLVGNKKLDCLCLNAGLARNTASTDVARTADGFELTVGTNYFGHYKLNQLLLPMINPSGGRVISTASGVHDPESPGGKQGELATLGELKGLEQDGRSCEMLDGGAFSADKAYKDSKLCTVLFTRELQRRLDAKESTKGITANCFNPGLMVGTGFFRDQNPIFTKLFDIAATNIFKVGESPEFGGGALAYMATVSTKGGYYSSPPGSTKYGDAAYGDQFTLDTVSKEAQDNAKASKLWELTEKAVAA